ncbi:hypothetical protein MAM1_0004d00497 [Mucor ambiguus]|uniref:BHLH domain-containing protein n=1 Tax=Mucor ambiguus TaxID=91626 RepID=A0A0C9M000_9FUNG|nr:hypothetical protein MAM1_0004d00497 [Mucor ambiguus]
MNTASTVVTNAFDLYSSRTMQQQAQTHHQQQQYPSLSQEQLLCDANPPSGAAWKRQHQGSYNTVSSNDCVPISQPIRDKHYSFYSNESVQNGTRNIKTGDAPPLFVGSAAEFSKMTTNNKYENEGDGYLNLIKEKSSNPTIYAEDQYPNQLNKDTYQDDTHEEERLTCPTENVVERKRYRRESHNAVERRRRNNINDNIRSLGMLLPENMCQGKLNKGTILQGSVMYIHMLNGQLSKYKERLEHLKYEAAALNPSLLHSIALEKYSHATENQQMP